VRRLLLLVPVLFLAVPASATTSRILAPMDWWPVWSPDGSHVAFTRVFANHMELDVLDLAHGRVARIGSNAGRLFPSWSSDGSRLAYGAGGVLYTASPDGSGKERSAAPTRAFAPAWRPGSDELAYLTTHGATNTDLWVAGRLWARDVVDQPAWSPDGSQLAVARDDGVYVVTAPGVERRLVSVREPRFLVWSRDGTRLAYVAGGRLDEASGVAAGGPGRSVPIAAGEQPSWSTNDGYTSPRAWSPSLPARTIGVGGRPGCPGHTVLLENGRALTGSCAVLGTAKADVIEGTPLWGDVIEAGAGNDQVHANDGHTDRVDCGPGHDTVWADRTDRLAHCEVIHR
jgi:Tol biopolymer transport system component